MIQHMINNAAVLFCILPADISHIGMLVITSVRQTELPVFIGLIQNRIHHVCQKLLRRVIKRHQNTELDLSVKNRLTLLLCFLRRWKAGCSMALHILPLLQLAADLAHQTRNGTVPGQTVSGLFIEMQSFAQRDRQLPCKAVLDPIQLKTQLFNLLFRLFNFAQENLCLLPLGLI